MMIRASLYGDSLRYPGGAKPPAGGAEAHMAPTTQTSIRPEVTMITAVGAE